MTNIATLIANVANISNITQCHKYCLATVRKHCFVILHKVDSSTQDFPFTIIKEKVLFMKVCFGHLFWTLVLPPALGDEVKKVLDNALHLRPADTRVSVAVKNPEQCQLYLVWSHRKLENGRPKDLPINMLRINCGFFSVKHNTIGQMAGKHFWDKGIAKVALTNAGGNSQSTVTLAPDRVRNYSAKYQNISFVQRL